MATFHGTKYMRYHILSHRNLTCKIGTATDLGVVRIFDWGGLNHKSFVMMSSKLFKIGIFCGADNVKWKIRSRGLILALTVFDGI